MFLSVINPNSMMQKNLYREKLIKYLFLKICSFFNSIINKAWVIVIFSWFILSLRHVSILFVPFLKRSQHLWFDTCSDFWQRRSEIFELKIKKVELFVKNSSGNIPLHKDKGLVSQRHLRYSVIKL